MLRSSISTLPPFKFFEIHAQRSRFRPKNAWQRILSPGIKKPFRNSVAIHRKLPEPANVSSSIASALFHSAGRAQQERSESGSERGRRERLSSWYRAATKVSRHLRRPVASWGPRYRYDVDIWRALLLHPRPVLSLLSPPQKKTAGRRRGEEWREGEREGTRASSSLVTRGAQCASFSLSLSRRGYSGPLFGPPSVGPMPVRSCDTVLL